MMKLFSLLTVLFAVQIQSISTHQLQICTFVNATRNCHFDNSEAYSTVKFPRNSCLRMDCTDCIQTWETKALANDTLYVIHSFKIQQIPTSEGTSEMFSCKTSSNEICGCTESPCSGTLKYCGMPDVVCEPLSSCNCDVVPANDLVFAIHNLGEILNPVLLSYKICFFSIPDENEDLLVSRKHKRNLLSEEEAAFEAQNMLVKFHDPVFVLPEAGTLIIRKNGQEIVAKISTQPFHYVTPENLLILPGTLKFLFVSHAGATLEGVIRIEGRALCRRLSCFFCIEMFYHLECLPVIVTYIIYALIIILTALVVLYIKSVVKAIVWLLSGIGLVIKKLIGLVKLTGKFSMLTGLITGDILRQRAQGVAQQIERRALQLNAPQVVAIAAIMLFFPLVAADCTNQQVLQSDVRECVTMGEQQSCKMWTRAQITLTNLDNTQCLWFTDRENQDLFKLELTFKEARCEWPSQRIYYTFPTRLRVVNQVSCSQNKYCAYLKHCVRDYAFPLVTQESLEYPGVQDCQPVHGYGICSLYYTACHHYRTYLIPVLTDVYEVRKISGYTCEYVIEIKQESNGTVETLIIKDSARTSAGIEVQLLGTLDQPVELLNDQLIIRLGKPEEAYLEKASDVGRPIKQSIGDVQAKQSYTKKFIFDEAMINCKFLDNNINCEKLDSYLSSMVEHKSNLLPLTKAFHKFTLDTRGVLISQLLQTAPLTMQLGFAGYKFYVETHAVCPKISGPISKPIGCYSCNTLAQLSVTAYSTCLPGTVQITFETVKIFTRTLRLTTEPKSYVIDFKAEQKCYQEKICLLGKNIRACEGIQFCLQEPTLRLNYPNISTAFSVGVGGGDSSSWVNLFSVSWSNYLGSMIKYPMYLLITLVMVLFLTSMVLSICKR